MKAFLITLTLFGIVSAAVFTTSHSAAQQVPDKKQTVDQDRDVRYARLCLKRAQAELQKVLTANEKLGTNMYPVSLVERLRENVKIAEEGVEQALLAKQGEEHQPHKVHIREAEAAVKIAELNLQQALEINKRKSGSYGADDLERLRLAVEIAQLRLEMANDPAVVDSPVAHLQWQVEQLRDEVLELRLRVEQMSGRD